MIIRLIIVLLFFILFTFGEWIVGRIAYQLGYTEFGLLQMAQSGWFPSRLPVLCDRSGKVCSRDCDLWTCPHFHTHHGGSHDS